MGTRHLIAVQLDGEFKVAQYGQWDGYPEGSGVEVLEFLRKMDRDKFESGLRKCRFLTDEERAKTWSSIGVDPEEGVNMEQARRHKDKYPELSRDTSSRILAMVEEGDGLALVDSIDFASDSLFCEWCYVVDMDSDKFEIFRGFNEGDAEGRFAGKVNDRYGPVSPAAEFSFDNLPDDEKFFSALCVAEE